MRLGATYFSILVLVGCLAGTQAGAPSEPGIECPSRPEPSCQADEEICYQTDETIGCSYRVCLPVGMCQSARDHRRLARPDD